MDTQKEEVEAFLTDFKSKMEVFDIVFHRSRGENLRTVLELELNNMAVRKCVAELIVEDYYKGPTKDRDDGPDFWEFGKQIKNREVYIKITRGHFNKSVICISFHFPVRTITYPFK
jgi:hypothetical protein